MYGTRVDLLQMVLLKDHIIFEILKSHFFLIARKVK